MSESLVIDVPLGVVQRSALPVRSVRILSTSAAAIMHLKKVFSSAQQNRLVRYVFMVDVLAYVSQEYDQEFHNFTMSGKPTLSMLLPKPRCFSPALIGGLRGQPAWTFGRLRHDRVSGGKSRRNHHFKDSCLV